MGLLWWLYTRKEAYGQGKDRRAYRIYDSPWRGPLKHLRPGSKEAEAQPLLLRQLSVLSLVVMGLIRFASGEPILNLF